jgi:GTPase SAR1 family protein
MLKTYYRGAHAAMLVYDITSADSFKVIDKWLVELLGWANEDVVVLLVGNKSDLEEKREVSFAQGQQLADDQGLLFAETSALVGDGVQDAFHSLFTELCCGIPELNQDESCAPVNITSHVKIASASTTVTKKTGGCC